MRHIYRRWWWDNDGRLGSVYGGDRGGPGAAASVPAPPAAAVVQWPSCFLPPTHQLSTNQASRTEASREDMVQFPGDWSEVEVVELQHQSS